MMLSTVPDQKNYYNEHAEQFEDRLFFGRANRNHEKKIQKICELLNLTNITCPEFCILEIGAGTGLHAHYVTEHFPGVRYVGVDLSEKMIYKAQKKFLSGNGDNWNFFVADGNRLPFRTNSFDAVFISGSLHHFPDPFKGLEEMYRIVKNGGTLALMEPNWLFPFNFFHGCFNPVERNMLRMRKRNLSIWASRLDLSSVTIENFIYTPPLSVIDARHLDRIDHILGKIPIISSFSIMIYLYARKIKHS